MRQVLKYKTNQLIRILFTYVSFLLFQYRVIAISASPLILDYENHTATFETYTYDEIESSVGAKADRTDRLSQVLLVKEVQPEHEVLAEESRVAAKSGGLGNPFKNATLSQVDKGFQVHIQSGKLELKIFNPQTGAKSYLNTLIQPDFVRKR